MLNVLNSNVFSAGIVNLDKVLDGKLGVYRCLVLDNNLSNIVGVANDFLDLFSLFILSDRNKFLLVDNVLLFELLKAFLNLLKNLDGDGLLDFDFGLDRLFRSRSFGLFVVDFSFSFS